MKNIFYLCAIMLFSVACKKEVDVLQKSVVTIDDAEKSISCEIDGIKWFETNIEPNTSYISNGADYVGGDTDSMFVFHGAALAKGIEIIPGNVSYESLFIRMSNLKCRYADYSSSNALYDEFFMPGEKPFYQGGTEIAGAEVIGPDTGVSNEKWSSAYGEQENAHFEILSVEDQDDKKLVTGTFSCKIYLNSDPTQFKIIERGNFTLMFHKY